MYRKFTAVLLAALLVVTALSPAAVSAQEVETTDLDVSLTQDSTTGNATVTVTDQGSPVEGAIVNVTSGVTYTGENRYTTDANGTVDLPNPDQSLEIALTATANGNTTMETFTLVPVEDSVDVAITQNDDGSVSLEVTQYRDALAGVEVDVSSTVPYAGNGTYTTDANGTVALAEPTAETEVTAVVTTGELEALRTVPIGPIAEFEVVVEANDDGTATVTVTRDDGAVDNATVDVTSDTAYARNGTYATDANGTVALPEPTETVNVTVTATDDDDEATADAQLSPVDTGLAVDVLQNADGTGSVTVTDDGSTVENATVTVTSDVAYDGNGTYNTSADGTVGLPAPDQNLTVTVTAINASEEATTTADLELIENGGFKNFGQWVSSYVSQLKDEGYFGKEFGQKVSEFATENNPGADNKPDHAGPPTDEDSDAEASDEDDARGPPEHAKNNGNDKHNDESGDESGCDVDSDADSCDSEAEESGERGDDETDDAPGNSGNKGSSGNNGNNGNGNGNGPKR